MSIIIRRLDTRLIEIMYLQHKKNLRYMNALYPQLEGSCLAIIQLEINKVRNHQLMKFFALRATYLSKYIGIFQKMLERESVTKCRKVVVSKTQQRSKLNGRLLIIDVKAMFLVKSTYRHNQLITNPIRMQLKTSRIRFKSGEKIISQQLRIGNLVLQISQMRNKRSYLLQ